MLDPENSLHTRQSLYTRLGGYDALAAFVRELMPRLHNDPELGIYWKGKSLDSRRREDKLLVDFLCAAFEGPVEYFGRDMKISHEGLGITEREWDKTIGHIATTLDTLGVAEREKTEVMQAASGLKWDIVAAPATSA
jgi:hemoglobin